MKAWLPMFLLICATDARASCGRDSLRRLVDSAALRSTVANLKAGRAVDQSELVRAIVANAPELPSIEKSLSSAKTSEAENVRRGFFRASERVQEIRHAYPELANVNGADEARLISLIVKLEDRRAPREKIHEALARGRKACRVP